MSPPFLRSRRSTSPTCRRSPACASRPARPASNIRAAPTCCSRCSTRARAWPACLTRSKCPSAPVEWCRAKLKGGKARALVVNSGNANAFTGKTGREAVTFTAKLAAQAAGCKPAEVFLASTGVIGEPLRRERIRRRAGPAGAGRRARPLPRCGERHHDHRHVSQGRDRARKARRRDGDDQRHRQGRRHDRARHGDHALLRVHRRADRGAQRCRRCCRARSSTRSTP